MKGGIAPIGQTGLMNAVNEPLRGNRCSLPWSPRIGQKVDTDERADGKPEKHEAGDHDRCNSAARLSFLASAGGEVVD